jgi:hypothetical protein
MENQSDRHSSDTLGSPELPRRRRHSSGWQNIPGGVKIAAAVCLVFLVVLLVLNRNRTPAEPRMSAVKPKISAAEAFDKVVSNTNQIDLVLTKAALNPSTSRFDGLVTNTSKRSYSDVEVVFFVSDRDLTEGTTTSVRVARLEPGASAGFASEPVSRNTRQWVVKSIDGTRQ